MDILISRNGEQHGPYPEASAREMLAAGQLLPTDLAWHAGADGWKPLSEVLGAAAQPPAAAPPPKPPGGGILKRTLAGAAPAETEPAEGEAEGSEAEDPDKIRVTRKGEPIGPYSLEKAEKYFADGQLLPTDWGWHDGMDEWKPLYEVLGVEVPAQTAAVATGKPGKGKKVALIVGIVVVVAGLAAAGYFFLYPMLKGGGVASAIDTNGTDTNGTDTNGTDNNGTDTAKAPAKAPEMDIFTAIKPENIEALKQHIAAGTDLETKEPNGSTPLLVAATFGHEEGVKLLLEGGANSKAVNKQGNTALHIAAFFAYPKVVNLLLVKGADAGAKSNDGKLAFQSVSIPWNSQVAGSYKFVYGLLQMPLDAAEVQRLQIARPQCARLLLAPTQKAMQQPQPNQ